MHARMHAANNRSVDHHDKTMTTVSESGAKAQLNPRALGPHPAGEEKPGEGNRVCSRTGVPLRRVHACAGACQAGFSGSLSLCGRKVGSAPHEPMHASGPPPKALRPAPGTCDRVGVCTWAQSAIVT
jgi:hypothetical protein